MSSREYNPCGRNDDDRDHPTPYAKDASDNDNDRDHPTPYAEDGSEDEEGRGEQAPYVEDAGSSREYDDDPQEGAAHYVYTGEDRCGYHRGSWMYLIKTSWETIQIDAPYWPSDNPIVTFPPSTVRLYVMGPDETEEAEDLRVQMEHPVDLTCTQDEEMGPGPRSLVGSLVGRPRHSPSDRPQRSLAGRPRHSPSGHPPHRMSPVPRATLRAKQ